MAMAAVRELRGPYCVVASMAMERREKKKIGRKKNQVLEKPKTNRVVWTDEDRPYLDAVRRVGAAALTGIPLPRPCLDGG